MLEEQQFLNELVLNFCMQVDSIKTDNVSLTNFQQILAQKVSPTSNFNQILNDFQVTCCSY